MAASMAKTKLTLDIEYDYEFILIGISCHSRDYKLCWAINKQQGFNFIKEAEIELSTKKNQTATSFSRFSFVDEDKRLNYILISNKGTNDYLIPEQKKQADYLIKIEGSMTEMELHEFINELKQIDIIQLAFKIDIEELKSKQNLLF